jgi:hypothetical protein
MTSSGSGKHSSKSVDVSWFESEKIIVKATMTTVGPVIKPQFATSIARFAIRLISSADNVLPEVTLKSEFRSLKVSGLGMGICVVFLSSELTRLRSLEISRLLE